MTMEPLDVVVVGAGLAGVATAAVLGRRGRRVAIVDPRAECPPVFKAEKIEPDQADLLRRLSLLDGVLPHVQPIPSVTEAHWGLRLRTRSLEQYGTLYQNLVNAVRRQIPASVCTETAKAVAVDTTDDLQTVRLGTGRELTARLVVVATGTVGRLQQSLGFERHLVRANHSLCSGFDIERDDGKPFEFDSLTYWADRLAERVDYATFFPVPGAMRVNLFSYRDPRDEWVHELARDPAAVLQASMPRLMRATGRWRSTTKVETRAIDLYVVKAPARRGIVLLGDSFQSVCPATGTGVTRILTDVERFCEVYAPAWLETPGMGVDKIASFYADATKVACDRRSLRIAEFRRRVATDPSIKGWLRRQRTYVTVALEGLRGGRA
jgi:2-polyprenyl-6-methoxyphenol hydroxylase-like FAD-dependent oxidoreductase